MSKINGTTVRIAVCVVIGIGVAGMIIGTQQSSEDYAKLYAENQVKISDLQREVDALNSEDGSGEVEAISLNLKSAADRGKNVAYLQNNYHNLDITVSEEDYVANAEALDSFFDDSSKNARVPWYTSLESFSWSFRSNYDFSGDTIDVVWLCEGGESSSLLAYTTATYDAKTNTFGNVKRHVTLAGAKLVPTDADYQETQDEASNHHSSGDSSGSSTNRHLTSEQEHTSSVIKKYDRISSGLDEYYKDHPEDRDIAQYYPDVYGDVSSKAASSGVTSSRSAAASSKGVSSSTTSSKK